MIMDVDVQECSGVILCTIITLLWKS